MVLFPVSYHRFQYNKIYKKKNKNNPKYKNKKIFKNTIFSPSKKEREKRRERQREEGSKQASFFIRFF